MSMTGDYIRAKGSDVRHIIIELRGEEVVTACGRVLSGDRVGVDDGDLCDNCLAKVA